MATTPEQLYTRLNNGLDMPLLGLGVYDMYHREAEQAVEWALETGYRLIDTAAMYRNETEIGNGIRQSGIPREQLFLTTKVNNTDQGYDQTLRAFDLSEQQLDVGYIDLYLVHWPLKNTRRDTWKALERLYADGRVRAIGVANYLEPFLDELASYASVVPVVNQVEFSPYLYLESLLHKCRNQNTVLQAYTPLIRGQKLQDPPLVAIAQKHGKTTAQVMLRWAVQLGVSTIPKSANQARLKENFDIFDFSLDESDLAALGQLNEHLRIVDEPMKHF